MAFWKTITRAVVTLTLTATPLFAFEFTSGEPEFREGSPYLWKKVTVEDGDKKAKLLDWLVGDKVDLGTATVQELDQLITAMPENQAAMAFAEDGEFRWLRADETLTIPVGLAPVEEVPVPQAGAVATAGVNLTGIDEKLVLLARMLDEVRRADSAAAQAEREAMRAEYLALMDEAATPFFYKSVMSLALSAEENGFLQYEWPNFFYTGYAVGWDWTVEDISETYRASDTIVSSVVVVLALALIWLLFRFLVRLAIPSPTDPGNGTGSKKRRQKTEDTESQVSSEAFAAHGAAIAKLNGDVTALQDGATNNNARIVDLERRTADIETLIQFSLSACGGNVLECDGMTDTSLTAMKPGAVETISAPDENDEKVGLLLQMNRDANGRYITLDGVHKDFARIDAQKGDVFTLKQLALHLALIRTHVGKMPGTEVMQLRTAS